MSHAENKAEKPDGASPALCSGGLVSCAPSVVRADAAYQFAFAMWLNANPRNAQENSFWKTQTIVAAENLRAAKRTANK